MVVPAKVLEVELYLRVAKIGSAKRAFPDNLRMLVEVDAMVQGQLRACVTPKAHGKADEHFIACLHGRSRPFDDVLERSLR